MSDRESPESRASDVLVVSASEEELIAITRALVAGPQAKDRLWSRLSGRGKLTPLISTACATLLEDALRHVWLALWQRGGTRPRGSRGRAWERHPPVALEFSSATLELLRWLVATPLASAPSGSGTLAARPLKPGDQVIVYLVLDALCATPAEHWIAIQPLVRATPLAWLGFTKQLVNADPRRKDVDFDSLTTGAGAIVIETLADNLATLWRAGELSARSLVDPAQVIALGAAQDAILGAFMASCDRHRRRDLAEFILDAAAPSIEHGLAPVTLSGPAAGLAASSNVGPGVSLATRAEARRASGALMRAVLRWAEWDQQHRGVRFIDDDYAMAQQLLARFERIGAAGVAQVERRLNILSDLAALLPTADPGSDTIVPR